MICDFFVYGTLKRGQCRERMWPRQPIGVRHAFVLGRLYDLGPYPAIRFDGERSDLDWIRGEVWTIARPDFPETIAALDRIEQTNQPGHQNLYDQVIVRVHEVPEISSPSGLALAYQYASCHSLDAKRLSPPPDAAGVCGLRYVEWPAGSTVASPK